MGGLSHFSFPKERGENACSGVLSDFFVEVIERGLQRLFVVRIRGVGEVVADADAREL